MISRYSPVEKLQIWLTANSNGAYSINNVATPVALFDEMLSKIDNVATKSILTLNFEAAVLLGAKYKAGNITCVVNNLNAKQLLESVEIKTIFIEENKNVIRALKKLNMKFDIVIGNPPYNESAQDRMYGETKRMSGTTTLGKTFTLLMISLSKGCVLSLQPYSKKQYGSGTQRLFMQGGLHTITRVTNYFKINQEVGCFIFDVNKPSTSVKDAFITRDIPNYNLGQVFLRGGTLPRHQYEHDLLTEGMQKVIITPSNIKYTNDPTFNSKMNDNSVGRWRVVFASNASRKSIGKVVIAEPQDIISLSAACVEVSNREEAEIMAKYLNSKFVCDIIVQTRTTNTNSGASLSYIPHPKFISPSEWN